MLSQFINSRAINVKPKQLEKAKMTMEDWMFIVNRGGVDEKEIIEMLSWFNKHYKNGVRRDEFRAFFPAIGTGQHLSDMVFR